MKEPNDLIPRHSEDDLTVMSRRFTRRTALAASGAAAVTAASVGGLKAVSASTGTGQKRSLTRNQDANTLYYGLGFDIDGTLDPQVTCFDSTIRVMLNVCEPLVWMPDATTIVPGLAESWSVSDDGLEWTFVLKQGVTFHDGTPFNAEAVKYSYERVVALDKYTAAAVEAGTPADQVAPAADENIIAPCQSHDQIGPFDHAEVIDDHTVKLVLTKPFAPFLTGLNGYLGIVSPTAVEAVGLAEFARKPVGTGPYMVEEWVEKDHITLVKNPDYNWGSSFFTNTSAAQLDSIVYKVVDDPAVRTGALLSGELQYVDEIDALQTEDVRSNPDFVVIDKPQPGSGWIMFFNFERPGSPQEDPKVRQALAMAIDKEAFNQAVFGGANVPASSPLMKPTFGYEPQTESMVAFDKAAAEAMLEEAGWVKNGDIREKDGKQLAFYWPVQDRPTDKNMATFVQGAWRDVGADVTVEAMERLAARDKRVAGDYDLSFLWFSFADPDILRAIFHSGNIGGFNFARYTNPEIDTWLDEASASQDPERRTELYSQIQIKLIEETATIPLADSLTHNGKSAKLQGEVLDFLASYVWMNDATLS